MKSNSLKKVSYWIESLCPHKPNHNFSDSLKEFLICRSSIETFLLNISFYNSHCIYPKDKPFMIKICNVEKVLPNLNKNSLS